MTVISKKLSILVVDDDPWTTRALTQVLSDEPRFSLLPAVHSGEEAIEIFSRERPDVVLMDINMPGGMSGVDATLRIRHIDPQATILILSTVSPGPGIARALDAGAVAVLNKTASEATLREMILTASAGEDPGLLRNLAQDILVSGDQIPQAPVVAPHLTQSERDVLDLICQGKGYEAIADSLKISAWTVKTHTRNLREKLQADNLAQLVVRALQFRFISA